MTKLNRFLYIFGLAASLSLAVDASAINLTGAGATFPYPIYAKWADTYKTQTGISLNYQSIGSGGGIKQIIAKTVDFGASDMPLKPEELEKNGLMQFPAVMGGVVPVINISGIAAGQLKLDGKMLADIFLGKITKSNDWHGTWTFTETPKHRGISASSVIVTGKRRQFPIFSPCSPSPQCIVSYNFSSVWLLLG